MGSNTGEPNEKPVHTVQVPSFSISKTGVTVAQYRACVEAGACNTPSTSRFCNWGKDDRDTHSVNCVNWHDAKVFAKWAGAHLPTEAEWEYAARSGGKQQAYPWGNQKATCDRAVVINEAGGRGCGRGSTWPVCSKPKGNTAQGVCDMAGNVWEWVEDAYQRSYKHAPTDGTAQQSGSGSNRVVRGGGYFSTARFARSAYRRLNGPGHRNHDVGFRLVLRPSR